METKELEKISNLSNEIQLEISNLVQYKSKNRSHIFRNFIKRFVDIIFGLFGVISLIPITIVIYVARKILKEDDGPIFYEQLRIGKNGKHFRLYKFRTMVIGADEKLKEYLEENEEARKEFEENHKLKNDPRITKLGKFLRKTSIDEMPQFWNVLKGEMSLIGPRPIVDSEVPKFGEKMKKVHSVKPGITGYWAANGRSDTTYEDRVNMEAFYAENYSLKMDMKIFLKTINSIFSGRGAF